MKPPSPASRSTSSSSAPRGNRPSGDVLYRGGMEPITPELALVDPDLRRADVARLAVQPFVVAPSRVRPIGPVVSPRATRSWPRRAAQVVALFALMAAGVLVANVAARNYSSRPVLLTNSTLAATAVPTPTPAPAVALDQRSRIEQQLLQLVIQSPSAHLPRALIDPRTGLALNNLQAVCHAGAKGGYLCVVRPALHKPGEGLSVRYGPNGFTWLSYRRG